MLHIHCGDCSADILKSVLPDSEIIVWCDLLFDGPLRSDIPWNEFVKLRAQFLSETTGNGISVEGCIAKLNEQEKLLDRYEFHDEITLWFDACMYDQFIMIRLLDWFNSRNLKGKTLKLICIGAFLGIERFKGLGQLNAPQMISLQDNAVVLSYNDLKYASRAWKILCSEKFSDIIKFADEKSEKYPYLHDAFHRFVQQYPSEKNGLNRLENEILQVVSEGNGKPSEIFRLVSDMEDRPFFGDTYVWYVIKKLSELKEPLLKIEGPGDLPIWKARNIDQWNISMTEQGKNANSC